MYLDRAEDLLHFWADEDGGEAREVQPKSANEIAAMFGGRVSHAR